MYPKQESQVTLESRSRRRLDAPQNRMKLYFDTVKQLQRFRMQYALNANRHRLLMNEKMELVGAIMDKDGFVVCKHCLINNCECWFSKDIFKTCIQHRRYLAAVSGYADRVNQVATEVEKLKESLTGIERYLKPPPSKFVMWAIEICDRPMRELAQEKHPLKF